MVIAACAGDAAREPAPETGTAGDAGGMVELLEGVRVDPDRGVVEFESLVAVDAHDMHTPVVYLEVICCTPDTREHESLVVTDVAPSAVHAALLAAGAEPGAPGGWREEDGRILPVPPRGQPVRVRLITADGEAHDPADWIVQTETGLPLRAAIPDAVWVFAGSRLREFRGRTVYDADGTGQLIGLHTFGSETVAWTRVESPDSWIDEPQWLANGAVMPPAGAPVTVRLEVVRPAPTSR